jgi:hypothetical protein
LRRYSGEATHHDAVSGTSEPWVVKMYDEHLQIGTTEVIPVITTTLEYLVSFEYFTLNAYNFQASENGETPTLSMDTVSMQNLSESNNIAGEKFI